MTAPFWSLDVRNRRDLLTARSQARSIACLLQFDPHDRICIAATVFLASSHAYGAWRRHRLLFTLEDRCLQVTPAHPKRAETAPWIVRKMIPGQVSLPSSEDLAWLARQTCGEMAVNPFDEIARQNDEILRLLLALREKSGHPTLPDVQRGRTAA